jgi:hypothetical protein
MKKIGIVEFKVNGTILDSTILDTIIKDLMIFISLRIKNDFN